MEFLLLGLLGIAVTWALVDGGSSGGGDEPPDPPDDGAGRELVALSNELLEGGVGDDTILAGEDGESIVENATLRGGDGDDQFSLVVSDSEILGGRGEDTITGYASGSEVSGGRGDDTIDIIADAETTVSGGGGNDTITADGDRSWIYGGTGNDVIDARGLQNSTIYGGAGKDLLILSPNIADEGANEAFGGMGNDTLRVYAAHNPMDAVNVLHGGQGNDVFQVVFQPESSVPEDWNGQPATEETLVEITDFQPGKDRLQLDIGTLPGEAQPEVTLLERPTGTAVRITYPAVHDAGEGVEVPMEMVSEIWLPGAQGVTMNDIRLVDLTPAA